MFAFPTEKWVMTHLKIHTINQLFLETSRSAKYQDRFSVDNFIWDNFNFFSWFQQVRKKFDRPIRSIVAHPSSVFPHWWDDNKTEISLWVQYFVGKALQLKWNLSAELEVLNLYCFSFSGCSQREEI